MCLIFEAGSNTYSEIDLLNFEDFTPFGKSRALGELIEGEFPVMQLRRSRKPQDIFTYGPWVIVSEKFIDALRDCGAEDCFQAFKAEVILKKGKLPEPYFVLHIVRRIDCLDVERSVCSLRNGIYYNFKKLVLEPAKVSGTDYIFKVGNSSCTAMFINSKVKTKFDEFKLRSVEYLSLEEWNNKPSRTQA